MPRFVPHLKLHELRPESHTTRGKAGRSLRGERGLDETIKLVKVRTRQFAKRQMTWFRGLKDIQWLQGFGDNPAIQDCALSLALEAQENKST